MWTCRNLLTLAKLKSYNFENAQIISLEYFILYLESCMSGIKFDTHSNTQIFCKYYTAIVSTLSCNII